ncbi:septal ring lytic transglycosylase RlpA family protein [Algihabitans albus]|uniref:septal ring lytic transglycosylase RlpA family protein n=1 Tax=Algihabitans albus TaxID=2164067 RepID=UPI000E5C7636|nr:septal ring lytic transglycosylase RlpA family protein [Algihabitans albus]
MLSGLARAAVVGLLAVGLAACGSSDRESGGQGAGVPTQGYYKVGRPYVVSGVRYTPAVDYDYDETGIASWYGPGFHGRQTANGEIYDQHDMTAAHPTLPMPTMVRVTNLENGRTIELRINDRGPFKNGRIIDVSRRGAELLGFLGQGIAKVRVQVMEEESRQMAAIAQGGRIAQAGDLANAAPSQVDQVTAAPVDTVAAAPIEPATPAPPVVRSGSQDLGTTGSPAPVYPRPSGEVTQVAVAPSSLFIQAGAFSQQSNALDLAQRLTTYGSPSVSQTDVNGQLFWRVRLGPLRDVAEADAVLTALIYDGFQQSRVVVD